MASVTTPTRRPYHSGTDALWGSSPAVGDTESIPSNGEIIAGHGHTNGITSGRMNWLGAMVGEWFQTIRNALFPQHTDAGGHWEVDVTGGSGNNKLEIYGVSGEAGGTPLIIGYDDTGTPSEVFSVHKDGDASFSGDLTCVSVGAGDITASGTLIGATVSQTAATQRTMVLPGRSGQYDPAVGTIVYGAGTFALSWQENDATSRRISYYFNLPEYCTAVKYRVVATLGNAANTVDATARRTDNGDNSTVTASGAIATITGATGIAAAEVAFSGGTSNSGQVGWAIDVDTVSNHANQPFIEKIIIYYTVGRL